MAVCDDASVETLTTVEAYEAMREFLRQFANRIPAGTAERSEFELLLAWTEFGSDGQTGDPAQWHDWEGAVERVLSRRSDPRP